MGWGRRRFGINPFGIVQVEYKLTAFLFRWEIWRLSPLVKHSVRTVPLACGRSWGDTGGGLGFGVLGVRDAIE